MKFHKTLSHCKSINSTCIELNTLKIDEVYFSPCSHFPNFTASERSQVEQWNSIKLSKGGNYKSMSTICATETFVSYFF